jgi:PilZ domain
VEVSWIASILSSRGRPQVDDKEKRRSGRIDLFASLQGEVTVTQPIKIIDIGSGGMRIVTSFALNLNWQYAFRLMIGDRSVVAVGRVVHTEASGPDQAGRLFLAGIEFIEVSASSQAIINDFIKLMRLAEFKIGAPGKPATGEPGQDQAQPDRLPAERDSH